MTIEPMLVRLRMKLGELRLHVPEVQACCPKCDRERRRFDFYVNIRKGLFFCFRCKFSGELSSLIGGGVATSIAPAPSELNGNERKPRPVQAEGYSRLLRTPSKCDSKFMIDVVKYLTGRGLGESDMERIGVGVSPNPRFTNRVIIPITEGGEWVYWVARSVYKELEPKEISPKKDEGWMPRREVLYGLEWAKPGKPVVLVEGVFDAERLIRSGYQALAVLGSHISDVQVGKVLALEPTKIGIMFDGDPAGRVGAFEAVKKIVKRARGIHYYAFNLPDGTDPAELTNLALDTMAGAML